MTPKYSQTYEQIYNTAKLDGISLNDKDILNEHAKSLGFDEDQPRLQQVRHQMNKNWVPMSNF